MTATNNSAAERLYVWSAPSLSASTPDSSPLGITKLRSMVEKTRPDVVIVDSARLFFRGDENEAEAVVNGLKALDSLRNENPDLTIVIVHHTRKEKFESPQRLLQDPARWADAVSGHHAFTAHVDSVFGLERQPDDKGDPLIVFGGIARNIELRTKLLEDDDSLCFNVAATESAAESAMTPAERKIWEVAKRLGQFRHGDLVKEAGTKNRKAVSGALKAALDHGLLFKEGDKYSIPFAALSGEPEAPIKRPGTGSVESHEPS